MNPSGLAAFSTAEGGYGSLINAGGNLFSGFSQSSMFGYQARIAQMNKQIALQNRSYTFQAGENQAVRYGMQASQRMGQIRAAQGASGIDVGSGSAAQVRTSQQTVTDMDLATIRSNTARTAYGYQVEAASDEAMSQMYQKAGTDAIIGSVFKAGSSLIGGATSVANKWYQMGQYGLNSDTTSWGSNPGALGWLG